MRDADEVRRRRAGETSEEARPATLRRWIGRPRGRIDTAGPCAFARPVRAGTYSQIVRARGVRVRMCVLELVCSCETEETIGHSFMSRSEEGHEGVCGMMVRVDRKCEAFK